MLQSCKFYFFPFQQFIKYADTNQQKAFYKIQFEDIKAQFWQSSYFSYFLQLLQIYLKEGFYYLFSIMEKTRTPSQIFTSSASSFFSAQSSTSSHYTLNNEQILQSFLQFLVRATPHMPEDVQEIKRWVKLITLIEETLNNDSIDVHIFGILDNMLFILHKMSESLKSNQKSSLLEDRDRNKQDTATANQTWSTVEKQTLPEIIITIQKIIFELFTGQDKDVYANAILSMDENIQKIFMIIIDYEMKKSSDLQNVEEDFSDEIKNQFTNNEFFVLNSISLLNNNKILSQAQKSDLKLRKSIQNSNLPVVELIDKVLILEQTNQNLSQALEKAQNMSKTLSKDQSQLDSANKLLSQDNRNLNIRICLLLNQIQNLQIEKSDQIANLQKKWEGRMQIVEKNKKQHISELIEINQVTQRKYEAKMDQYQERLEEKREKIKKLQENEQKLQIALKQEQMKSNTFKQEVESLNEIVRRNREELNELQLLKDSLTMEIDIRNNRIEDLRLLLISETNKIPKSTKYLDPTCGRECCLNVPDLQSESQCGKQWRRESRRSRFQTLAFNRPHYVSQSDTGYSWYKNSFTTNNKKKCLEELAALSQSDLNKHYETHFNFLTKKIEGLQKQNQKFRSQLKKARDYKLQNSKLTKSLLQHQSYRGEENQILMGCLYELRAMTNGKQFSEIELSQQRIAERIRVIKQNHLQSKSARNMKFVSMQSLEEGFSEEEDDHDYGGFLPKYKFNQSENINFFSQVDTDKHSAQSQVQSNGTCR